MSMRLSIGLVVFLALAPVTVGAKIARVDFGELVASSDYISVVEDLELLTINEMVVARARVLRTLRGPVSTEVFYLASPAWVCDTSTALVGERSLLLLQQPSAALLELQSELQELQAAAGSSPIYFAAHAGRGRMPVSDRGRSEYAAVSSEVTLPRALLMSQSQTEPGTLRDERSVSLEALEDSVLLALYGPRAR